MTNTNKPDNEPVAWANNMVLDDAKNETGIFSVSMSAVETSYHNTKIYTHPATPSQADLKRVLEGLECGLSNCGYLAQVSPSWNRMMKDDKEKIRAAITLIEGAIK